MTPTEFGLVISQVTSGQPSKAKKSSKVRVIQVYLRSVRHITEKLQQRKRLCVAPEINNYTTDVNEYKIYICIHCTVSKHTFHDRKKMFLNSARNVWFCKKHRKLTGPRLERAILRQAKRVPNDNGSSVSTVGELNPRESSGGNSSRSIP